MTIKQHGGIFGRNPTFNDLSSRTAELNGLAVTGSATITTADNTAQLTLISTDANAAVGPILTMWRDSASPANGDLIGEIRFLGEDSNSSTTVFSTISAVADQVSNGAEDGSIRFKSLINNVLAERLVVNAAGEIEVSTGNLIIKTSGKGIQHGTTGPLWTTGTGSPESVVTAPPGSLYTNTSGGLLTTLYVKETGTGNTGWVAK